MTTRRRILWLGGAAVLPLAVPRGAFAGSVRGTVVAVQGPCVAEGAGGTQPLKPGDTFALADTLRTPADGRLRVTMSDNSSVTLSSDTRLTVTDYQADAAGKRLSGLLTLAQGLIHAVVAAADRPDSFRVATAVGTAAAHGTDWFMETHPGWAQVGVLSGEVSLASAATGHSVTIPSRWGGRLEAGRDPVPPRVWAPAEFQAVIVRTDLR